MTVRGGSNLLKAIHDESKMVSEGLGISVPPQPTPTRVPVNEESMAQVRNLFGNDTQVLKPVQRASVELAQGTSQGFDLGKSMMSRLLDSIDTAGATGDYFNALQSLFTLYAVGELDELVLERLKPEDLNEIMGILSDFARTMEEARGY